MDEVSVGQSSNPNTLMQYLNLNEMEHTLQKELDGQPKLDMLGQRYYCILTNDVLNLFDSEEQAAQFCNQQDDHRGFPIRPAQSYTIFRFS